MQYTLQIHVFLNQKIFVKLPTINREMNQFSAWHSLEFVILIGQQAVKRCRWYNLITGMISLNKEHYRHLVSVYFAFNVLLQRSVDIAVDFDSFYLACYLLSSLR